MLDKRKFRIFTFILVAVILASSGIGMIYQYMNLSKAHYVRYDESSDLSYQVKYKENKFFDDKTIPRNNKYIASLIDNIKANFKYNIRFLENNLNYNYSYKIVANLEIFDTEDKEKLYENKDVLYESKVLQGGTYTNINKLINIDYNKYNDLSNKFKNTYDLKEVESTLNVDMYVNINSNDNEKIEDLNKRAVVSLKVPLNKKMISIEESSDLEKSENRKLLIKSNYDYSNLLIIGIIEILLTLIVVVIIIIYSIKTRTIKNIYDREIKKILNNYEGYIQKISNNYKIGTSQVIKVESFLDMLEIRDTLKTPILMLENEMKDGTFFIIPAANGIIYAYALRMIDIIARKRGIEAPDYDLKNINKKLPKKYTSEFIDKQIEETRSMRKVDIKNTIEGTKKKDANLYDQLDKTITMKPIKTTRVRKVAKKDVEKEVKKTTRTRKTKDDSDDKKTVKRKTTRVKKDEDKKTTRKSKTTKK